MTTSPPNNSENTGKRSGRGTVEEQILDSHKKKQERQFLEDLSKRIAIAREGKVYMERKDFASAMTSYRRYLSLTARALKVDATELKPSLFDVDSRNSESLLITAVYLDLMKMLDRLQSSSADEERKLYQRMFIRFTVGQSFQAFAAENLRKYIYYTKGVRHKKEFIETYNAIKVKGSCFVATWAFASEDAPEVVRLRTFRDQHLRSTAMGRFLISTYYKSGPTLVRGLSSLPAPTKQMVRAFLATISKSLPK